MFNFANNPQLNLEDISYEWLQECTDPAQLRRGIKLIEEDGNYFVDLKKEIEKKLAQIQGHSDKPGAQKNQLNSEEKQSQIEELMKWKESVEKQGGDSASKTTGTKPNLTVKQSNIPDIDKKKAENEKNKGNEAMASGDYKEAISYYSAAIKLDHTNPIYFSNRAMAHLKLKDYRKAIDDSNSSIEIDRKYTKGFYRRAKANEALGNLYSCACDFQEILHLEPNNKEVAAELEKITVKFNPSEKSNFEIFKQNLGLNEKQRVESKVTSESQPKKFVKIQIEEDSDDENGVDAKVNEQIEALIKEKERICEKVKLGDFLNSVKDFEQLLAKVENVPSNPKCDHLKLSIYSNISHCYKQSELEKPAIDFSSKVIDALQPKFDNHKIDDKDVHLLIKALMRRGLSYESLERLEQAYADFHMILAIQPGNNQAAQCISRLSKSVSLEVKNKLDKEKSQRIYNKNNQVNEQKPTQQPLQEKEPEVELKPSENHGAKKEEINVPTEPKTETVLVEEEGSDKSEPKPQNQEIWISLAEEARTNITNLKNQGNEAFKKKDYRTAIDFYSTAVTMIEPAKNHDRTLHFVNTNDKQLYVDLLSNRSLAFYYASNYRSGFYDANDIAQFAPENLKIIYRRAINAQKFADEFFELAKSEKDVDLRKDSVDQAQEKILIAINDYEVLIKGDPQNQQLQSNLKASKASLESIMKLLEKSVKAVQVAHPNINNNLVPPKPADSEEERVELPKVQRHPPKKLVQVIEQKTSTIAQEAIKTLLEDKSLPKTSSQFETDINSFKGDINYTLSYLSRFQSKQLAALYTSKQLEYKIFEKIINSLSKAVREAKLPESEKITANFLVDFANTHNYKLTLKMLIKREKQDLRSLIQTLKTALPDASPALTELEKLLE